MGLMGETGEDACAGFAALGDVMGVEARRITPGGNRVKVEAESGSVGKEQRSQCVSHPDSKRRGCSRCVR